jgi:hypothetical protein
VSNIVPFGKYKGQPVEVLAADHAYCDWLTGQSWFRERYGAVYTLIVNNFAEPSETPEHNALQARFLDDDFCCGFFRALQWKPAAHPVTFIQNIMREFRIPALREKLEKHTKNITPLRNQVAEIPDILSKAEQNAPMVDNLSRCRKKLEQLLGPIWNYNDYGVVSKLHERGVPLPHDIKRSAMPDHNRCAEWLTAWLSVHAHDDQFAAAILAEREARRSFEEQYPYHNADDIQLTRVRERGYPG